MEMHSANQSSHNHYFHRKIRYFAKGAAAIFNFQDALLFQKAI